ncbi:MAG: prolyl-tRNA synthetase associated domain-containing protein [Bacteroidales bacterium]|nr:prolyl-tRNA synthetase associated domain-containing protein [Bacteroidales bacterium]MBQ9639903.1 prolyl-tRNA synthetase associated domain-containing protein [Bacteroidales bacterium]
MIGQPRVYECLSRLGIPFDYYEHPEAPTIEIASQYYRGEGTTLCKNLFFRNHKGDKHYLVIMDARHAMDIHDMEHRLHQGKLSFASPERLMRHLGVRPGSVSLFALVNDATHAVTLFIDRNLLQAEKVSFHPNDNRASLVISSKDMMKFVEELQVPYSVMDLYETTENEEITC